jgi:hypothetical protein
MNASIGHVFVRISSYGVCLEPRARTEHDETRPRHGRLVSGRRCCKSCCVAGASALCRPPGRKAACGRLQNFAHRLGRQCTSATLIRSRPNTQPQPGQAIYLVRRMAVIRRAAIPFDHTYIRFRPPSIASRFPRHRGLPDGQHRALEDDRLATGQLGNRSDDGLVNCWLLAAGCWAFSSRPVAQLVHSVGIRAGMTLAKPPGAPLDQVRFGHRDLHRGCEIDQYPSIAV